MQQFMTDSMVNIKKISIRSLRSLLITKKIFYFLKSILNYVSRTFEVLVLFIGVLKFNFEYINAYLFITILVIFIDTFIRKFKFYRSEFIPSPQKLLNCFLLSSFFVYMLSNPLKYYYIAYGATFLMLLNLLNKLLSFKVEDFECKISQFSTTVHELGHFFANEEYKLGKSIHISLVPHENTLGHIEIGQMGNVDLDEFISFLMAGFISSKHILSNHKPDVDETIDIVNVELKSFNLQDEDKNKVTEKLNNKIETYRIMERTINLIKNNKDKILLLAGKIQGKDKILCEELNEYLKASQKSRKFQIFFK